MRTVIVCPLILAFGSKPPEEPPLLPHAARTTVRPSVATALIARSLILVVLNILSSLVDYVSVRFAGQSSLQDDRPAQVGRLLGIEAVRLRETHRRAVDEDEIDHRVLSGLDDGRARLAARCEHRGVELAQRPDRGLGSARADRPVAVLHDRVGLGPRPGGLTKLQRGFVREAYRPPRS